MSAKLIVCCSRFEVSMVATGTLTDDPDSRSTRRSGTREPRTCPAPPRDLHPITERTHQIGQKFVVGVPHHSRRLSRLETARQVLKLRGLALLVRIDNAVGNLLRAIPTGVMSAATIGALLAMSPTPSR